MTRVSGDITIKINHWKNAANYPASTGCLVT